MSFTIETPRLILQVENSDAAPDVLAFYEKNKALFEAVEPTRPNNFYTLAYQTASMQYEYNQILHGKSLRYYIYRKEQPTQLIGTIHFFRIEHGPFSRASIGYKIDADFHRQGYATEACEAAIPCFFSDYRIHRLEARVATDNTASIRLLEHLGFQFEGIEYSGVEVNGVFCDHFRYGLISTIQ